jgi:hypothetical protein
MHALRRRRRITIGSNQLRHHHRSSVIYYLTDDPDVLIKWKIYFMVLDPGIHFLVFRKKDRAVANAVSCTQFPAEFFRRIPCARQSRRRRDDNFE